MMLFIKPLIRFFTEILQPSTFYLFLPTHIYATKSHATAWDSYYIYEQLFIALRGAKDIYLLNSVFSSCPLCFGKDLNFRFYLSKHIVSISLYNQAVYPVLSQGCQTNLEASGEQNFHWYSHRLRSQNAVQYLPINRILKEEFRR